VLEGVDVRLAERLINEVLAQWSSANITIFFNATIVFDAGTNSDTYIIGSSYSALEDNEVLVNKNPFNTIRSAFFRLSNLDYPIKYLEPKQFDGIPLKRIGGYPQYYTYEVQQDYTIVRFYPFPQYGMVMKLKGKQKLSDVTLFETNVPIPKYAFLPLKYCLANELINSTGGNPQPNFYNDLNKHMARLMRSNKQDVTYEYNLPFKPVGKRVSVGRR